MTIKNHYGIIVNSDEPVAGVISQNLINWEYIDDVQCLSCEEWYKEIENSDDCQECEYFPLDEDGVCPECGWDKQELYDNVECDADHEKIIGDWIKNDDGLYVPDKENGEFAAVLSSSSFNDVTVIWSKFIKENVSLCSPCAPGQASIDSNGEFKCYTLPEYLIYKDDE